MAIIKETGAIVTGANSYQDVDDIKDYFDDLGYSYSAYTDSDIEAAALRTMRYIESKRFLGYRSTQAQPLSWPRSYVYDKSGYLLDDDYIPKDLNSAVCEGTFKELATTNALQADSTGGGVKRKRVDVLETEWFEGADQSTTFTVIEDLLSWLVVDGAKTIRT